MITLNRSFASLRMTKESVMFIALPKIKMPITKNIDFPSVKIEKSNFLILNSIPIIPAINNTEQFQKSLRISL